jgi:hypothetical protein
MRLERDAFELSELAERWDMTAADTRYLVASDKMRLSVRIIAHPVVISERKLADEGHAAAVPAQNTTFTGLADLSLRDAFRLLRDGETRVDTVFLPGERMVKLCGDEGMELKLADLLVRRAHAEALEGELIGMPVMHKDAFDFRLFVYDEQEFAFTVPQARALSFLLEQTRAGAPDQHYLSILNAVGSASQRLGSLFSRKPHWTRLLLKTTGRRGWYHLDPAFVIWLLAHR